jgi:hypothetical protein
MRNDGDNLFCRSNLESARRASEQDSGHVLQALPTIWTRVPSGPLIGEMEEIAGIFDWAGAGTIKNPAKIGIVQAVKRPSRPILVMSRILLNSNHLPGDARHRFKKKLPQLSHSFRARILVS